MKEPVLNNLDRQSATWKKLIEHMEKRLETHRKLNDDHKQTEAQTAIRRGRIAELKYLMKLADDDPPISDE